MIVKVVFQDGSYFIGDRKWYYFFVESWGACIYKVMDGSEEFKPYVGQKIMVGNIAKKYWLEVKVQGK